MQAGLKRLVKNALLLLAVVFVADRVGGAVLEKLFYRQNHGDDMVSIYALEKASEDILVFGGSRASHHYVTAELARRTGMSCFNGGRDNMDIIYTDAILKIITKRYLPRVIVLDVTYLDLANYASRGLNVQRTSTALLPFAPKYPELYPTIQRADKLEKLKAQLSRIYPYNSLVGSIIQNTYTHFGHISDQGYEPLYGHIDSSTYKEPIWGREVKDYPLDSDCVRRLDDLLNLAKERNIRVIAIFSPLYFPFEFYGHKSYLRLKSMVTGHGFEFYDFSRSAPFFRNPYFFADDMHMNDSGAHAFTQKVAELIRKAPDSTVPLSALSPSSFPAKRLPNELSYISGILHAGRNGSGCAALLPIFDHNYRH